MKSESVGESVGESSALEGAKEPKSKRGKDSKWKHLLKVLLGKASKMAILMAVIMAGLWALGFAMRIGWIPTAFESDQNASATSENSRYVCPMMCVEPSTVPGRCPVCAMELVPASPDSGGDSTSIFVAPVARRLIGVRTAEAKLRVAKRTIRTIGSIQYDESQLSTISAYVDGRLEKLYANYVGVPVKEGDSLALLYSPELYTAQAEYLSSQAGNSASRFVDADSLRTLAREKLFELGMSEEQMKALEEEQEPRSRLRLESPQNGTVIEKLAVEGDYVKTGQTIFRVADLSTVWMMLDLFPEDASRVFFGQEVEAEISSAPGIVFTGRVAFVDPTVNAKTRSVRVRVEILNLDGQLRPGDYASARISISAI
ncbi:MAG: efflux RND transporter periplasmic adaptor subunit, partial [Planctomycetota bacterium]